MKRTILLTLGVASLFLCTLGLAQQGGVREDGIQFSLDVFAEWNDNRDAVSGQRPEGEERAAFDYRKEDNLTLGITPRVNITREVASGTLRIEYAPTFRWWDNPRIGQRKQELTHEAFGEYRYHGLGRTEAHLRNNFKYIDDPDIYMGSEEAPVDPQARRITEENSHFENRLSGGIRHHFSERYYTDVNGFWRLRRFDDAFLAENGDEDEWGVSTFFWRQHSPTLNYGLTLAYRWYDRESRDDLPMGLETFTVGLAGRYRFNQYVDGTASYGYQYAWHESDDIDNREYPTDLNLELQIVPMPRARLVAGVRSTVTEGYVYPYVSQELIAFYSAMTYRHTSRLSTTLRAEYRMTELEERYTNPETPDAAFDGEAATQGRGSRDGDRDELYVRAGLNYRLRSRLLLSCYYAYTDVDSDVSSSYSRNTVGVRARYDF